MRSHTTLVALFERLSVEHKDVAHETDGRRSFFLMNRDAQIINATSTKIDYPLCVLQSASGRFKRNGDVSDATSVVFEIRQKIATPGDFEGIEQARAQCKEIGTQMIAYLDQLCELEGACGPIDNFDPASVAWEFIGPLTAGEYGCRFRFNFDKTAYNRYSFDSTEIFTNQNPNILADSDDEFLADDDGDYLTL